MISEDIKMIHDIIVTNKLLERTNEKTVCHNTLSDSGPAIYKTNIYLFLRMFPWELSKLPLELPCAPFRPG
jgi:hypothetical protein